MAWWVWLVTGLALLGVDVLIPSGFFILFFGLGAASIGLLLLIGLPLSETWQWSLWAILSLGYLAILRRPLMKRTDWQAGRSPSHEVPDEMKNAIVEITEVIQPGARGAANCRGSIWTVQNVSDRSLNIGDKARVERLDGLTLFVRAI